MDSKAGSKSIFRSQTPNRFPSRMVAGSLVWTRPAIFRRPARWTEASQRTISITFQAAAGRRCARPRLARAEAFGVGRWGAIAARAVPTANGFLWVLKPNTARRSIPAAASIFLVLRIEHPRYLKW